MEYKEIKGNDLDSTESYSDLKARIERERLSKTKIENIERELMGERLKIKWSGITK